jgi:Domain of unknown function (DUF4168)
MRSVFRPLAAVFLGAAWLLAIPAADAQTQNQQQPKAQAQPKAQPKSPSGAPGAAMNIPDQKLDAAAAAISNVANVTRNYQQQIAAAPEADRPRIADEANNALKKAVTDQGLSVEEYNSIIEVAQNDPEVHNKIVQRLKTQAK